MSFYALAPKDLQAMIAEEEKKKRLEEEKKKLEEARKEEKEAEANAVTDTTDEKPEKDISDIYEHPQSKLFTKMLGLAGSKAVPSLASDPTSDPTDVRVLDRKLEEDEERLKKDNKRWRGIIYLTVAVCLVIFCLVVTQVISSVTSSAKPLPNIDVSEPHSSDKSPRPEPLVASLSSLPGANQKPGEELPEPVETDVVEIETMVAKIAAEESGKKEEELEAKTSVEESLSGDLEGQPGTLEFIPVPLGEEEEKEKEAVKEDEPESPRATTRRPPLFIPMMFEQRGVAFDNPIPEFIRRHFMSMMGPPPQLQAKQPPPPFEAPADRPRHPFLELFFKGEPDLAPPSLSQEAVIVTELPEEDLPTPGKNPFLSDVLRGMKALLKTVKPLLADEPLPEELPFPSPLRPTARLIGGLERRPPPQRSFMAPQGRAFPSRFPQPQPRRPSPQQQRGFVSPPVAFRPGPLRAPVSVVPPQPANQRRFPQRPTNQRVFPPRGPAPPRNFHQSPPVNQRQQFPRPPFLPQLHESSSTRHFNNNPRRPETLVGNPLYSYPNTATGIQDIIQHIRRDKRPQNGHGAFQAHSPNIHFSSSDRFNNNGGFHGDNHHHGNGGNHHGNEGYSGPIYPPGYEEQQIELGSPDQPFHLMLDVYPVEDSDRYPNSDLRDNPALQQLQFIPEETVILPGSVRNTLDTMFTGDMPIPEARALQNDAIKHQGRGFQNVPAPEVRAFPMEIEFVEGRSFPDNAPPQQVHPLPHHMPNHPVQPAANEMAHGEGHPFPHIMHHGGGPRHSHRPPLKLGFRNEEPPHQGGHVRFEDHHPPMIGKSVDGLILPEETAMPHYAPAPHEMRFDERPHAENMPHSPHANYVPQQHQIKHFSEHPPMQHIPDPTHVNFPQVRDFSERRHPEEGPPVFIKDMSIAQQAVHPQGRSFPEELPVPQPLVFRNDNPEPQREIIPEQNHSPQRNPFFHEIHHPHDMVFGEGRPIPNHAPVHHEMHSPQEIPRSHHTDHVEVRHFSVGPAKLSEQHLSDPREVPPAAISQEQEGILRHNRTPLYKLLLGGDPRQEGGHFMEDSGVPEGGEGPRGHVSPQGIYFTQEKRNEGGFPLENPFLPSRVPEEVEGVRGARRFDGNPFLLF